MTYPTRHRVVHSTVELLNYAPPRVIILAALVRKVECEAIEQSVVALLDLARDFVEGAAHRVRVQHVIGDLRRHRLPVAFGRLFGQALANSLPSVDFEHRVIDPGRSVERDLTAAELAHLLDLLVVAADRGENRSEQGNILAAASALVEPNLNIGQHALAQVLDAVERMHMEAVAQFTGELADVFVYARYVDRDIGKIVTGRGEERRHQGEVVVLAGI